MRMGTFRRRRRAVPLLVAGALVLAACGGTESDGGDGGENGDSADSADEQASDADSGGTDTGPIRVSLDSDVDVLEPHFFRTDAAYALTAAFYEPLIVQDFEESDGFLQGVDGYVPGLAESWEISDDGLEATFELRQDAEFADGTPITADDVRFVFQRAIEGPGYIAALLPFIGVESVDQIEVVDDHTLIIRPSFESPLFERFVAFQVFGAMDASAAEEHGTEDDEFATEWFTDNVTASGPYTLASLERGREAVLEPNPGYHSPDAVQNDGVILRVVPNAEERALLLRSGELDVADGLPPRVVQEIESSGDLTVHRMPSSRITYVGMNNTMEPFDDVRVRQAISYAIPYEAIRDQVLFGYGSPAYGPVPPAMETSVGEDAWEYDTDLERATELLEEAGAEGLSTELAVRQSVSEDVEAATFIQDSLRQIGVDVQVNQLPDAEYNERLNARELPMFFHDWYSWGEDPFFQMQFLLQSESFTNYAGYANPEVDQLIADGTFELDEQRRADLSAQAQETIIEDAPWAFLYAADYLVVTQPNITGVTNTHDQLLRFSQLRRN